MTNLILNILGFPVGIIGYLLFNKFLFPGHIDHHFDRLRAIKQHGKESFNLFPLTVLVQAGKVDITEYSSYYTIRLHHSYLYLNKPAKRSQFPGRWYIEADSKYYLGNSQQELKDLAALIDLRLKSESGGGVQAELARAANAYLDQIVNNSQ